jgi:hypothetical protein
MDKMNEVIKQILEHNYEDKTMKKQVFIARRSKSTRIQNKAFTKLLYTFMKEKPVKIVTKVALDRKGKYIGVLDRIEPDTERMMNHV